MATYKGIQGYTVQKLSSDPTASEAVGQLWYNSAAGKFKIATQGAGTWASANSMPAIKATAGSAGTTAAAFYCGGSTSTVYVSTTFNFDGTNWSAGGAMNSAASSSFTFGIQTAAIDAGGYQGLPPAGQIDSTESYNGTAWTETGNTMNANRDGGTAAGTATAGLAAAGQPPAAMAQDSEEYDGSTWTESNNLNNGRGRPQGSSCGTQTAALCFGSAEYPAPGVQTESYDGTSWSTENNMTRARGYGGGAGTSTAALAMSGMYWDGSSQTKYTNTEKWDGTSWTEVGDVAAAKGYVYGCGTQSSALLAGGVTGPSSTSNSLTAEVFTDPVYTIKTVTVS
jgi:hypothetical protein